MFHRFYEVPTVTIFVGKDQKPFYVHLDLLCNASTFFKAAFLGNFKEGSEKTMQLPEDDEETFELFVDWLYYQRYEMLPKVEADDDDEDKGDEDDEDDETNKRYLSAFRLFVFANKYMVSHLKNLVIETLFVDLAGQTGLGPGTSPITYAYENTTRGSGLRKLVADYHSFRIEMKWYEHPDIQALLRQQPDLSIDLNISFAKRIKGPQNYSPFNGAMPEEYKDKGSEQEK